MPPCVVELPRLVEALWVPDQFSAAVRSARSPILLRQDGVTLRVDTSVLLPLSRPVPPDWVPNAETVCCETLALALTKPWFSIASAVRLACKAFCKVSLCESLA